MFMVDGVAEMSDADVLDLLRELEREQAALDAVRVRALARMAALRPDRDAGGHRFAGAEVGAALAWTPAHAAARVATATRLMTVFPCTVDALAAGRVDLARARALAEITATLSDEHARQVETWILDRAEHKTIEGWRTALRAKKDRVDPDGADRRREQRRRERRVNFHVAEDGMAHLDVYDTGERLRAVYLMVDKLARTRRAQGATDRLDALRADALHDLVVNGNGRGITVELQVAVPFTVLLGANTGGTLAGYGTVTTTAINELISGHDTTWRRIIKAASAACTTHSKTNPAGNSNKHGQACSSGPPRHTRNTPSSRTRLWTMESRTPDGPTNTTRRTRRNRRPSDHWAGPLRPGRALTRPPRSRSGGTRSVRRLRVMVP